MNKSFQTEKLYDEDVMCRVFSAKVLRCEEKNGKYEVVFNRTAFFPEGGGQPADTGAAGIADVSDVQEKAGEIVHTLSRPVPVGSAVLCGVNWSRRFRHMQQHTGEHIVSGIANRLFGADNVGFHMGEAFLTVDWNVPLDAGQLATVERLANETVWRNLPVLTEYPKPERFAAMKYRSKKELSGPVRIVSIPGCDVCACCGTHVPFTGEVGAVKIISAQNYKGGTRISLVCGAQAMEDYAEKLRNVTAVSGLFSAKPEEIGPAAERLLRENAELQRRLSELQAEVFEQKAAAVSENCGDICTFEKSLSPDDLRRFALLLAKRCRGKSRAGHPPVWKRAERGTFRQGRRFGGAHSGFGKGFARSRGKLFPEPWISSQ